METPHIEPMPPDIKSLDWLRTLDFMFTLPAPLLVLLINTVIAVTQGLAATPIAVLTMLVLPPSVLVTIGLVIGYIYKRKAKEINERRRVLGLAEQWVR